MSDRRLSVTENKVVTVRHVSAEQSQAEAEAVGMIFVIAGVGSAVVFLAFAGLIIAVFPFSYLILGFSFIFGIDLDTGQVWTFSLLLLVAAFSYVAFWANRELNDLADSLKVSATLVGATGFAFLILGLILNFGFHISWLPDTLEILLPSAS